MTVAGSQLTYAKPRDAVVVVSVDIAKPTHPPISWHFKQRGMQLETPSRSPGLTPSGSILTTSPATQRLPGERYAMCCTETIDQSTVTVSVGRYYAASVSTSPTSWNAFTSRSPSAFSSSQNLTTAAAGTPGQRYPPSCRLPLPTRYTRY